MGSPPNSTYDSTASDVSTTLKTFLTPSRALMISVMMFVTATARTAIQLGERSAVAVNGMNPIDPPAPAGNWYTSSNANTDKPDIHSAARTDPASTTGATQ